MKATKLTESINFILNEDMFAKYTVKQLYDKLGEEEFIDYIDKVVKNILKNIKGLDKAKLEVDGLLLTYKQEKIDLQIILWVVRSIIIVKIKQGGLMYWTTESKRDLTSVGEFLKDAILDCCEKTGL